MEIIEAYSISPVKRSLNKFVSKSSAKSSKCCPKPWRIPFACHFQSNDRQMPGRTYRQVKEPESQSLSPVRMVSAWRIADCMYKMPAFTRCALSVEVSWFPTQLCYQPSQGLSTAGKSLTTFYNDVDPTTTAVQIDDSLLPHALKAFDSPSSANRMSRARLIMQAKLRSWDSSQDQAFAVYSRKICFTEKRAVWNEWMGNIWAIEAFSLTSPLGK